MDKVFTLQHLSKLVCGVVIGDGSKQISGLNSLELAKEGDISFVNDKRFLPELAVSGCGAVIVAEEVTDCSKPQIVVANPDLAAAIIHNYILAEPFRAEGVHDSAVVGDDCSIPEEVSIGANAVIGNRVKLGQRVVLAAGVVIEDEVEIGDDTVVHANATIARGCIIGSRVVIYHGAVIGSDGFGFATDFNSGKHVSKPQVGIVKIDDDVHIGANSCVDRAAFGVTHIKSGVRIDNQVMVAHNVVVGDNSVLVGQAGIAGSTVLGRSVMLGSRAAVSGYLHLGDGVKVAALGGVHHDLAAGSVVGGVPAIDIKQWGKAAAAYSRLPEMRRELRRLRKEFNQIRKNMSNEGKKEESGDE